MRAIGIRQVLQAITAGPGPGTPLAIPKEAHPPHGSRARETRQKRGILMLNRIEAVAQRPIARRWLAATAGLAMALAALPAKAQDTIKVGILHSLSGTMAISETTLKDVMLMLIDEQNKKGGLLGKKLEAVVVDPRSDWPTSPPFLFCSSMSMSITSFS